jgi:hypothetical protein
MIRKRERHRAYLKHLTQKYRQYLVHSMVPKSPLLFASMPAVTGCHRKRYHLSSSMRLNLCNPMLLAAIRWGIFSKSLPCIVPNSHHWYNCVENAKDTPAVWLQLAGYVKIVLVATTVQYATSVHRTSVYRNCQPLKGLILDSSKPDPAYPCSAACQQQYEYLEIKTKMYFLSMIPVA